ncbi:hypothetical protein H0H10_07450 [Streptomyces sp. TRM S81-3]|uniref:PucR C-terminal helix-turn-helix domain-containing protein n=1 Tax=Streptomyces griseicoloratus TaxID=2752516 RepID=A0A926KZV2_9ACTN|nr:hypothetical protein [Streptomyces griseicoloratus]MBD0419011.1 hypothetical protein [Streptomyces griseicoloratus]
MQELVGRLTALDPEASETLKVVTYFDTLVTAGAGLDALLRGAAALSGVVAGADRRGRISRRGPDGQTVRTEPITRSPERACSVGAVWLERIGPHHANDQMIVERLALSLDLIEARRNPVSDLEIVIDPARTVTERTTALAKLRVDPGSRIRIMATRSDTQAASASSAVVPTKYGIVRATLCRTAQEPPSKPAGLGQWVRADHAPDSWDGAVIALRLTDATDPVVDATDLGALLLLARAHDPQEPHDDIRALARLDARSAQVLRALVEADSLRAAAAALGMHHSTLQARHDALTRQLGYDPRTAAGKVRYAASEFLLRLTDPGVAERPAFPQRPHDQTRHERFGNR